MDTNDETPEPEQGPGPERLGLMAVEVDAKVNYDMGLARFRLSTEDGKGLEFAVTLEFRRGVDFSAMDALCREAASIVYEGLQRKLAELDAAEARSAD